MNGSIISSQYFHNEEAAYKYIESRIWPHGPICPHCGETSRISMMRGKTTRINTYKCYACRKPFTVKIGTIFEDSHIPMRYWLQAIYLMAASKKGISANQLHRTLGVTLKTAWFMGHRIREAMREGELSPFGSKGGDVEVDETFIGKEEGLPVKSGYTHKQKVLSLLDRDNRETRSMVVDTITSAEIIPILKENIAREATVITDDALHYESLHKHFWDHVSVAHMYKEYVHPQDPTIHTNTIEGYFSIFKRGMKGVYQHCKKKHLHRYLAEFDFRYNKRIGKGVDDLDRAEQILRGVTGRRLTYETTR